MTAPLHIQSIGGTDLEFDSLGGDLLAIDINGTDISKQFVIERPDQARLFLYLAKNLAIDTDMLYDVAHSIGMGTALRGAGGDYSPMDSFERFGAPIAETFRLAGAIPEAASDAMPERSSIAVDPWPTGRPNQEQP